MTSPKFFMLFSVLFLPITAAHATSTYEYGPDEYVTVSNGISPDAKLAITAHGEGEDGDDNFHIYLTDAVTGKKIGPLEEIKNTLDTGAGAFAAKWSSDSREVTIVYRVDRHEPLKAVSYRIAGGRAQWIQGPFDVKSNELLKYWQTHSSEVKPSPKIFGTPRKHD